MRTGSITRKTAETDITLSLCLDGGDYDINTGSGFLDHMLTLFARHGDFGLTVSCIGDTHVDYHHTVEDVAICLGTALRSALGSCAGIARYGDITLPMDEALILCAVDVSGRGHLEFAVDIPAARVGDFDTELTEEFLCAFTRSAAITAHLRMLSGRNTHHIIEGCFKALARALSRAVRIEVPGGAIPSTKGMLI